MLFHFQYFFLLALFFFFSKSLSTRFNYLSCVLFSPSLSLFQFVGRYHFYLSLLTQVDLDILMATWGSLISSRLFFQSLFSEHKIQTASSTSTCPESTISARFRLFGFEARMTAVILMTIIWLNVECLCHASSNRPENSWMLRS